ncbi:Os09g0455250 [Oryza sativa Japonica Group]|uniref:Os09g0455250 protein n=1 Tax=Oryza sativa subsp. japonica TaxID=39947 RepID=A0A0P0XNQ9_ORYSJ|nr:hypothetical protein EE612_048265 [Oryza sativa]BAT08423.1 Os09g0455250 [Oryza sativa Japonica Group]
MMSLYSLRMCASSCSSAVLLRRRRSFSSISTAAVAARPAPPASADDGDGAGPPSASRRVATGKGKCGGAKNGGGDGDAVDADDVFLRWISVSSCFSPFLKNSFANSHLSGTTFLNP